MKRRVEAILATVVLALYSFPSFAYDADQVRIVEVNSINPGNHLWVKTTGNTNCPTPNVWFIIDWNNVSEARTQIYQLAITAFATGKNVRVIGATCYLNQYLVVDQLNVYE